MEEGSYEKIKAEALAPPANFPNDPDTLSDLLAYQSKMNDEAQRALEEEEKAKEPAKEPEKKEEKAKDPEKKEEKAKEKKKVYPRRECPDCGKSLSVSTKKHKCYVIKSKPPPDLGGLPEESVRGPSTRPPETPQRGVTLDDVTNFLWADLKERGRVRRERLMAQMF